ncbi:MAG: response regulator, partial [Myxococcales bacterium]|nr:response regulator [Myxococcales bacterium]
MERPLILLVEDHPLNRMLLTDLLEEHGIEVAEAVDADAGCAWLAACADRRLPDLVLTDIQMPGGGGQRVLRAVRD